ncbi:MAG TPA: lamin tail domain-containing protein, partial [Anaerolineales bacterium]|nr:lamin tail domain-containing protein [Anaerolineales bacterium]
MDYFPSRKRIKIMMAFALILSLMFTGTVSASPSQAPAYSVAGDVIINEIMQNPNAVFDSAGEWLELYNTTGADIDLNGWTIQDNDIDTHVIAN